MKCDEVQRLMVAYLDGEVTPSERALVRTHLAGCAACQRDFDTLSATRQKLGLALHHLGDAAQPPLQAWDHLEARLAEEAGPSPARPSRKARDAAFTRSGGIAMSHRLKIALGLTFSGAVLAAALALGAYFMFKAPTPVSAQEIIEKAAAAQAAQANEQGIQHRKFEQYQDFQAMTSPGSGGLTTRYESFLDPVTSKYRSVTTNADTGWIVDASGFDGTYLYTGQMSETPGGTASPLIVYKSPAPDGWAKDYGYIPGSAVNQKAIFEQMKNEPGVEYVGTETWVDGREVYVLRSPQQMTKFMMLSGQPEGAEPPVGHMILYIDTQTYQTVETRTTAEINGQEVTVVDFKLLVEEIVPATTAITWDLSDVTGISIVDDPEGEQSGPWLQSTLPDDLASSGMAAYKLMSVPDGFSEAIMASEPGAQEQIYVISYRNAAGEYVVIQSGDVPRVVIDSATEIYTTASGLTLYLQGSDTPLPGLDKPFWSAAVETPEGMFTMNVNMPLERVKQLAEDLIPVD